MSELVAPRYLPDGTVSWEGQRPDLAQRIRDGDGQVGWLGDESLSLMLNTAYKTDPDNPKPGTPRWEVWRRHDVDPPSMVCSMVTWRINEAQVVKLLTRLAASDSRTHDIASEHLAARDAKEALAKANLREQAEGHGDRLAHALGKDLGAPMPDGKIIRLGGR